MNKFYKDIYEQVFINASCNMSRMRASLATDLYCVDQVILSNLYGKIYNPIFDDPKIRSYRIQLVAQFTESI